MSRSYKIIDKANDEVVREEEVEKCTECKLHKTLDDCHVRDWQCLAEDKDDGKHFNDVCEDKPFPDSCPLETTEKFYTNNDGDSWAVKEKDYLSYGCVCIFRYDRDGWYSEKEAREKAEAECKRLNAMEKCQR